MKISEEGEEIDSKFKEPLEELLATEFLQIFKETRWEMFYNERET